MCVGGWKQLIESSDQMWIALCIYKVYSEMSTDTNLHQTFWIEGNIHQCKFQILWKTFCSVLAIDCGFSWQSEMGLNLITVFGQLQLYDSTLGRWGEAQIFVDFQKYFSSRSVWTQPKFIFSICCLFNINIWLQMEWITHLFNRSPFFSRLPDLVQSVEV